MFHSRMIGANLLGAMMLLAFLSPASSHHSHASYANDEEVNLTGTITEVRWLNPHVWVYMDIPDANGEMKNWALEGASVGELIRKGWAQDSMKPGDRVSVRCWPLRDGSDGCLFGYVLSINDVVMESDVPGRTGKEFD